MKNEIGCKRCSSPDCSGCNMFVLYRALRSGVFDPVMSANRYIDTEALMEKLLVNATAEAEKEETADE